MRDFVLAVLLKDISFQDIHGQIVLIPSTTQVLIDVENDYATFNGVCFSIDKHEYQLLPLKNLISNQ